MKQKKPVEKSYALFGIFGYPLEKSPSPKMHNSAFKRLGLNHTYLAFRVEPKFGKNIGTTMKLMDMLGANITAPFKESIMPQLDMIDSQAKKIGSVNTVINKKGRLIGYNTDAEGYRIALKQDSRVILVGKVITIIGAGGTARAIAYVLSKEKVAKINILNRHKRRAEEIAVQLPKHLVGMIGTLSAAMLKQILPETDILIQTTSYEFSDLELGSLKKGAILSDVLYHPTPLAKCAKKFKIRYIDGLDMLIRQAEIAFKLFTGKSADPAVLKRAAKKPSK